MKTLSHKKSSISIETGSKVLLHDQLIFDFEKDAEQSSRGLAE